MAPEFRQFRPKVPVLPGNSLEGFAELETIGQVQCERPFGAQGAGVQSPRGSIWYAELKSLAPQTDLGIDGVLAFCRLPTIRLNICRGARHTFTGEGVLDQTSHGQDYHPQPKARSWQASLEFPSEVLNSRNLNSPAKAHKCRRPEAVALGRLLASIARRFGVDGVITVCQRLQGESQAQGFAVSDASACAAPRVAWG